MLNEKLAANRTWFDFTIQGFDSPDGLSVYAFSGQEKIHEPYEFVVELVSRDPELDLTAPLGREALLTIRDRSGERRLIHGIIRETKQLHTAHTFTHYRCFVVPRLWFLSETQDHRIYQHLTVDKIIETVLAKHHFTAQSYELRLRRKYQPREYCVQYGESDLHFLSRICEEKGIYFFFEHEETLHRLCFCDVAGGPPIPGENSLRFFPGSGQAADTVVVARLRFSERINSDETVYREWNFTKPALPLNSAEREPDPVKAPTPPAMKLERYQFPHLYQTPDEGERYAGIQLERQLTWRTWIEAESDASRFIPGHSFTLHSHPRQAANRDWWVVSVSHEGEQPQVLEHEAPEDRGIKYCARLTAIPLDVRFVPALRHPKVRIDGLQSALVTGPPSEEVFPDEYGRVKVKFHWDRSGKEDETTTCWVRVADAWAGMNFGAIMLPRVGQEVTVEFMEGDPDRPVITGRVYNAAHMPPWELPQQKPLSGIQSREFGANRRNQLVMDDTGGQIQVQLSSDHGLAQLNLGHITRLNHGQGRKDFRGEGFELRTDDWGVVRAGKGLVFTTDMRAQAEHHQKDISEAADKLQRASDQHENTARLAAKHNAQDGTDASSLAESLHALTDEVRGDGRPHGELTKPHMVFSSPVGVAVTTPGTTHIHTGENTAISAGRHCSVSTGQSFLVTALGKVGLFAHKLGMRLFAARGKVEIQAQTGDLEIIAQKVINLISAQENVNISAAKEIMLTAGGSYISVSGRGIEEGTAGSWKVHASSRSMSGPKSRSVKLPTLPTGDRAGVAGMAANAATTIGRAPAPSPAGGWTEGPIPPDWLNAAPASGTGSSGLESALKEARDKGALLEGHRFPRPGEPSSVEAYTAWREIRDQMEGAVNLRQKLEVVEREVGKRIAATPGEPSLPDTTLLRMAGDSHAVAVLKYALLEQSGVSPDAMDVVAVVDPNRNNREHTVLAVMDQTAETPRLFVLDSEKGKAAQQRLDLGNTDYTPREITSPQRSPA